MGTEDQKCARLLTGGETDCEASSRVFCDLMTPQERPVNTETAPVTPWTRKHLLVRHVVAGIPVHFWDELTELTLKKLTTSRKGPSIRVSTALGTLVLHAVQMVVS